MASPHFFMDHRVKPDYGRLNIDNLPTLSTLSEVADLLRVSKLTLKRWEKKKIIIPIRINKRGDRRYTKETILSFLKKAEHEH